MSNKKTNYSFFLRLAIFTYLIVNACFITINQALAQAKETAPINVPLQVPIFGYTTATDLAGYIKNLFQYGLYALVPLAIIIIIYAGIKWILAGGNQAQIKEAKTYITGALTGLIIGLLSYVILSFVGITQLKTPGLENIETIDIPDDFFMFPTNQGVVQGGTYQSVGGKCFPVPSNSLVENRNNFGASRAGGARQHAGVDLITKAPGYGIAIADGEVLRISNTFKAGGSRCTRTPNWWISQNGGPGDAGSIYIYHPSLGVTVNYGENDVKKVMVKVGQQVKAGQILAVFGPCRMMHFELYQGKRSTNIVWSGSGSQPSGLLDPTKTLDSLAQCTPSS